PLLTGDPADVAADVPQLLRHFGRRVANRCRDLEHGLHQLCIDARLELMTRDRGEHRVDVLHEIECLAVEEHVLLLDAERVRVAVAEPVVEDADPGPKACAFARDRGRVNLLPVVLHYWSLTPREAARQPRS